MEIILQKWGNSDGIRIPSTILKSLKLKTNDKLELIQEDDKIIITKSVKQKISLKERFENYHGENLAKEFTWDDPVGREIW
jgi:antitoxin MazE